MSEIDAILSPAAIAADNAAWRAAHGDPRTSAPDAPGTALVSATPTDLAAIAQDPEWISRESSIRLLESEVVDARDRYVRAHLDLGRLLMEHRDLCRDQDARPAALWDALGLTPSSAYRLIRVASAVQAMPTLRDLAERQYGHALTLIEGSSDDQIQAIAAGDQSELPLDEIGRLSIRELRRRLRQHETDSERATKRATRALTAERDALIRERDRLAALTGDDLDSIRRTVGVLREQAAAVATTMTAMHRQLEAVRLEDAISPRGQLLLDEIERELHGHGAATGALWQTWLERREADWGRADTATDPD